MSSLTILAMPPPTTFQHCCTLALLFGAFCSACVFMVARRLPLTTQRSAGAACITSIALLSGLAFVLVYPIRQAPEPMPHWIGYSAQDALLCLLAGATIGCLISPALIPLITRHVLPKTQRASALLLIGVLVAILALAHVFTASPFVGAVVLLTIVSFLIGVAISIAFNKGADSGIGTSSGTTACTRVAGGAFLKLEHRSPQPGDAQRYLAKTWMRIHRCIFAKQSRGVRNN